jgi:hypothetical protein
VSAPVAPLGQSYQILALPERKIIAKLIELI